MLAPALALALQLAAPDTILLERGFRDPAYGFDGRIAFELHGDLWMIPPHAPGSPVPVPVRVTHGPAWDRGPAWAADGSLLFSSDRGGNEDLWRIRLTGEGSAAGEPERIVSGPEAETQPSALPEGGVVFVRGTGAAADLWHREPDGSERRLTEELGAEHSPAASPDGRRIAYVAAREGRRELRVRALDGGASTTLAGALRPEGPAWSPDGQRVAFATRGGRAGVWIAAVDGSYVNQVSARAAAPAWHPDGEHVLLAGLPPEEPAYNGDPDRLAGRVRDEPFPRWGGLWLLRPSETPDREVVGLNVAVPVERALHAAAVFDRVWRTLELQLGDRRVAAAEWQRLRARHRAAAVGARSERELELALHALLRERAPLREEAVGRAAVSSAHPLATAAGLEMLRRGGNVVDAAVAVSFALGVVEPDASGIGGYGAMLLHLRGMERPVAIEFLTRVPQAASLENGALALDGRVPSDGPVVVNVPGTVAGMWHAWSRYGSGNLAWSDLLRPAIDLAEQGFVLDDAFPTTLAVERERFWQHASSRALFFPDGEPLQPGDTLRNPDLAWTLREIARGGADAFYRGEIARRMVADLHGKGNAMRLHDLARYHAAERVPVVGTYRGHTVYASPPATSGGALLVGKLNLLEGLRQPGAFTTDAATLHAMIEAWKLVPSTRGRVADPGLWPVDLSPFTSKDAARARWRCFDPARSSAPADAEAPACAADQRPTSMGWGADGVLDCAPPDHATRGAGCRMSGTTAFAVADAAGNLVSVTQTLGTWGGNFYVTPGLGFLYNDKLRSYSEDPDAYNARIPFARNVTSISPTLVFRGTGRGQRPWAALGAAGNAWITAAVYQTLAGLVDQDLGPQAALELPRFLVAGSRGPDGEREVLVQMEHGYAPGVVEELRRLGHRLWFISAPGELRMGYGAAVVVEDGVARAGADPRRSGAAGAVPR